jgi:H+-transporting ATPase
VDAVFSLIFCLCLTLFVLCSLDPCECNNLNDWASFVLLLIELNLVVYADYSGSKSSGDAIKQLKKASASKLSVKRGGEWVKLTTRDLVPGDLVAVNIGMTIPADGVVASEGEPLKLDYSSLTGEPLPEKKGRGDPILSGAVVLVGEGEMIGKCLFCGYLQHPVAVFSCTIVDSYQDWSRILSGDDTGADCRSQSRKGAGRAASKSPKQCGHISLLVRACCGRNYWSLHGTTPTHHTNVSTLICFVLLMTVFVYVRKGMNFGSTAGESIKLAFVILSTILPVTMPLVLTTTLAVGAQELAKDDAVVQRFSAIPEMAGMDILCSDKTGTLTLGQMSIIEEDSLTFHDDVTVKEMMELALVCTRIEHSDAIDAAITKYFDDPAGVLSDYEIKKFIPFDPATKKVTAVARKKSTGEEIIVVKGAPPVLMVRSRSKGLKIEYQAISYHTSNRL